MTRMSSAGGAVRTTMCTQHRSRESSLRCDRCERPFCRDCLVSRFVTSRSSVWLCRRCAGIETWQRYGWSGGAVGGGGGGLIRHPRSAGAAGKRDLSYWLAAVGLGAVVLLGAWQRGLLG